VENVNKYLDDWTGGPTGQLSVNWGVADFIIKNAANNNDEDGLNNIRLMGDISGIELVNGYLKVEDTADLTQFRTQLPKMTVMAVHDIPVNKAIGMYKEPVEMDKKVSLVYASAVPVNKYTNGDSIRVKAVAFVTLVGQYTAALRAAIDKRKCDAYLMPLGGGVFQNSSTSIKAAIGFAVDTLQSELIKAEVNVFVLVYSRNQDEINKFRKTPAAVPAAVRAAADDAAASLQPLVAADVRARRALEATAGQRVGLGPMARDAATNATAKKKKAAAKKKAAVKKKKKAAAKKKKAAAKKKKAAAKKTVVATAAVKKKKAVAKKKKAVVKKKKTAVTAVKKKKKTAVKKKKKTAVTAVKKKKKTAVKKKKTAVTAVKKKKKTAVKNKETAVTAVKKKKEKK
jgi:hypothetical protein